MRKVLLSAIAVVALGASGAWADEPMKSHQPSLLTDFGMSAEIGGGVSTFLDKRATDITRPGGSWTARVMVGTRTHFGAELAYVGGAQQLNTIGVDQSAVLMSNGVEGQFRYNLLTGDWQPYATAGYTWRHYQIQNSATNTSSVASAKNVGEIPVSIGLAWRYKGFVADVRASVHNAFNSTLIPATNTTTFDVGAKLGFEF